MLSRTKLLGSIIGFVAAGALLAPVAAAPAPAPVTVSASTASAVNAFTLSPTCTITVDVTWDDTELNGPAANLQLFQSTDDGDTWVFAGMLTRTDNDGTQQFALYNLTEGSYRYQVLITKGPKHMVAIGTSNSVDCTP